MKQNEFQLTPVVTAATVAVLFLFFTLILVFVPKTSLLHGNTVYSYLRDSHKRKSPDGFLNVYVQALKEGNTAYLSDLSTPEIRAKWENFLSMVVSERMETAEEEDFAADEDALRKQAEEDISRIIRHRNRDLEFCFSDDPMPREITEEKRKSDEPYFLRIVLKIEQKNKPAADFPIELVLQDGSWKSNYRFW